MDTTAQSFGGTALHVIWDELFIAKLLESRPAVAELFQQCRKVFSWTTEAYWVECGFAAAANSCFIDVF
jgi:hypothetical protein